MIIMHPLPRVDELSICYSTRTLDIEQAFNGVVARMALMCWLLGVKVPEDVTKEGVVL